MYGKSDFDIIIINNNKIYDRIKFSVMMDIIIDINIYKLLLMFPDFKNILNCLEYRFRIKNESYDDKKINIHIKYLFNNKIVIETSKTLYELIN